MKIYVFIIAAILAVSVSQGSIWHFSNENFVLTMPCFNGSVGADSARISLINESARFIEEAVMTNFSSGIFTYSINVTSPTDVLALANCTFPGGANDYVSEQIQIKSEPVIWDDTIDVDTLSAQVNANFTSFWERNIVSLTSTATRTFDEAMGDIWAGFFANQTVTFEYNISSFELQNITYSTTVGGGTLDYIDYYIYNNESFLNETSRVY